MRTTISLPKSLHEKAQKLMKAGDYADFSGFLQQLIREEYERRAGPICGECGKAQNGHQHKEKPRQ